MPHRDAAVAIVHAGLPQDSILLIRRTERPDDSWSGHWSFPGGRRDLQDCDLLDTALRELEEECGIRLAREQVECALPQRSARRRVGRFVPVAPFVFKVEAETPTVLDPREAVESRWVPLRLLRDPARHALRPAPGLPAETLFPAIDLGGVPLWGFTYRLITDWLGLDQSLGAAAGFEAARQVLDFVLSLGLRQHGEWEGKAVRIDGAMPVMEVLDHFRNPAHYLQAVNRLEVSTSHIRIAGPAFEEYLISSSD